MKRRIFTLLLCALLTAPTLLSCSSGETKETDTTADPAENATETETETETLSEYEKRQLISDDLADNDFGGPRTIPTTP